jgi:hypothetical protein
MDHTEVIAALRIELEAQKQQIEKIQQELNLKMNELTELRQRLELRNISAERLQSQFTLAAEALNKLLAEREAVRRSRWAKIGSLCGFLPKFEDDLR